MRSIAATSSPQSLTPDLFPQFCPLRGNQNDLNSDPIVPVDSPTKLPYQLSIKMTTDKTLEF